MALKSRGSIIGTPALNTVHHFSHEYIKTFHRSKKKLPPEQFPVQVDTVIKRVIVHTVNSPRSTLLRACWTAKGFGDLRYFAAEKGDEFQEVHIFAAVHSFRARIVPLGDLWAWGGYLAPSNWPLWCNVWSPVLPRHCICLCLQSITFIVQIILCLLHHSVLKFPQAGPSFHLWRRISHPSSVQRCHLSTLSPGPLSKTSYILYCVNSFGQISFWFILACSAKIPHVSHFPHLRMISHAVPPRYSCVRASYLGTPC